MSDETTDPQHDTTVARAISHYSARRSLQHCCDVPEWGRDGTPLGVWAFPATLEELDRIDSAPGLQRVCEVLMQRARDRDGKRLFARHHRLALLREIDPYVQARVVKAIEAATAPPKPEDAEGE
jgi:hypothetical protein